MTGRHGSALRAALASHEAGRGKRYPAELKARITEFARARRGEGASWAKISSDVGVPFETLRRWCVASEPKASSSRAMVSVRIVPDAAERTVTVGSPGGFRIEGLTLHQAVDVLRSLG
jgi:transposase-like protein